MSNQITAGEMQLIDIQKRFIAEQRKCLMTKREQFAAAALQGILAYGAKGHGGAVAEAYMIADAMIKHGAETKVSA